MMNVDEHLNCVGFLPIFLSIVFLDDFYVIQTLEHQKFVYSNTI